MPIEYNPDYIHHTQKNQSSVIRELVFGMEDGMVSTLGAVTGIAAATGSSVLAILSGLVVVAVESISMAVGSYLSSKSVRDIEERMLDEERAELKEFPEEEEKELVGMYVDDGWSEDLAKKMAAEAAKNSKLFLQEMAYRELKVFPDKLENPLRNGAVMGLSYVVGGVVPLVAYFIFSIYTAIFISIVVTLFALFFLGVYTTKYSRRRWWKAGLEMFALASAAALVGYIVGQVVEKFFA